MDCVWSPSSSRTVFEVVGGAAEFRLCAEISPQDTQECVGAAGYPDHHGWSIEHLFFSRQELLVDENVVTAESWRNGWELDEPFVPFLGNCESFPLPTVLFAEGIRFLAR